MNVIKLAERRDVTPSGQGLRVLYDATAIAYLEITGDSFADLTSADQVKWLFGMSAAFELR